MYCQSCGKQIPDDSRFCRFCDARQAELPSQSAPPSPPPAPQPIELIVPESAPALRRVAPVAPAVAAAPVAPVAQVVAATPVAPVAAAVATAPTAPAAPSHTVTTSGEWDYADFVHSFAGQKLPAVKISGLSGGNTDVGEARKLFWQSFQGEISADLQRWTARGWQPTTIIGPEALEMRKFNGYRDKGPLFWIIVLVAAIPSVGMSLIWGLIPAAFVEPTRFVAKLRAPHGTPLP